MIGLPQIKARIDRLRERMMALAREELAWKGAHSLLHMQERRKYLGAVRAAQAALDDARATLAGVVERLEREGC